MKNTEKNKLFPYIILTIIILLQLVRIVYSFAYLKEDFHSDEIWSFGLSNSYYEPFVYQSADHTEQINKDKWVSSEVLKNYITVNKEQRFDYGSVYFNQVHDYHPPLYYFIIHTICSLFPDRFSPWNGFIVNIVVFIVTMIYFYNLLFKLTGTYKSALIGCAFYGFSMSVLNDFVFLRMYCMVTMFAVMSLFYHAKLYKDNSCNKYIFALFWVTLSGCLTHHFFIPFAGCISLCFFVYYLLKKNIKLLLAYSISMLGSVAVSLLVFPATIEHLFSGRIDDSKFTFNWQLILTLNCVLSELFGLNLPVGLNISFGAVAIVILCLAVIASPLVFLFRNEQWFKKCILFIKNNKKNLFARFKQADLMVVSIIVSSLGIIVVTALTVSFILMQETTDRYLFFIMPGCSILFILMVSQICGKIIKNPNFKYGLMMIICVLFCFASNTVSECSYLLQKPDDVVSIETLSNDSNCVFISSEYWLLTCFSKLAMNSDNFWATTDDNLHEKIDNMSKPPDNEKNMYYFIDKRAFYVEPSENVLDQAMPVMQVGVSNSKKIKKEEFENTLQSKYVNFDYVGYDKIFNRDFLIYKVG